MRQYNPIPDEVLTTITTHRPDMQTMCGNYRNLLAAGQQMQACQIGNAIANGYLAGETRLTAQQTWLLGHHCLGSRTQDNYYGYGKAN